MIRRGIGRVGRPGVMGTVARTAVIAGTASAVAGGVAHHQQGKEQQAAEAEPPLAPAPDMITQLKELASLRDAGVLTEAEFAAQKAKLLA
ncbi:MAG: SHOCT domain-containing protein [Actinomycetes bacterium]|jgi:hypothetical protein|nr:SHOCT domain-containing protein [Ilumatobacteraceae bacterium]